MLSSVILKQVQDDEFGAAKILPAWVKKDLAQSHEGTKKRKKR
jgi:hypothetical protein